MKRGLSVVTMPTSISDGLKSADNTDDRQLMAVCGYVNKIHVMVFKDLSHRSPLEFLVILSRAQTLLEIKFWVQDSICTGEHFYWIQKKTQSTFLIKWKKYFKKKRL